MSRKLIDMVRRYGSLIVTTEAGDVDASSTATVHGEGPNVTGFRWARNGQMGKYLSVAQANALNEHFGDAAADWAATK